MYHQNSNSSLLVPEQCRYALGMEDGRIKDQDLSASSQWYDTTGPQNARSVLAPPTALQDRSRCSGLMLDSDPPLLCLQVEL